jgi:hypothetical protein
VRHAAQVCFRHLLPHEEHNPNFLMNLRQRQQRCQEKTLAFVAAASDLGSLTAAGED